MDFREFKDKISKCRQVESGIWDFIHADTTHFANLIREHAKLEQFISELYREITLIGQEHDLFEHIHSDFGKRIVELLRSLRGRLAVQYEDLLKIKEVIHKSNKTTFTEQELMQIRTILDGEKSGQNESETSQKIKQLEEQILIMLKNAALKGMGDYPTQEIEKLLSNLIIENPAKSPSNYTDSLQRLREAGFQRHLLPKEHFGILLVHLRTNGQGKTAPIANDILWRTDEWLSCAFKREGNILHIALNPESLVWNDEKKQYESELKPVRSFNIGEISTIIGGQQSLNISSLPKQMVEFLYGTRAMEIFEYSDYAGVTIPDDEISNFRKNTWWPVIARRVGKSSFYLTSGRPESSFSRGCKPI